MAADNTKVRIEQASPAKKYVQTTHTNIPVSCLICQVHPIIRNNEDFHWCRCQQFPLYLTLQFHLTRRGNKWKYNATRTRTQT